MRTGMGFRHWKRVEGSKCAHCLQQCRAVLHFGHVPSKSMLPASVVGGVAGGLLLLGTAEQTFQALVPYLILGASALLAV